MRPPVPRDGHGAPRHLGQPVPIEAAVADDVVIVDKNPVGQPFFVLEMPSVFRHVQFRSLRR
jgi:hypothetical protein